MYILINIISKIHALRGLQNSTVSFKGKQSAAPYPDSRQNFWQRLGAVAARSLWQQTQLHQIPSLALDRAEPFESLVQAWSRRLGNRLKWISIKSRVDEPLTGNLPGSRLQNQAVKQTVSLNILNLQFPVYTCWNRVVSCHLQTNPAQHSASSHHTVKLDVWCRS